MIIKSLRHTSYTEHSHWVGDGFPIRTLFSYNAPADEISPFLHLDYIGPAEFLPAINPKSVGLHPHRGMETVSLLYQGEVEHRDTAGHGGVIKPGDVQWMTAASGLRHEEKHSAHFTQQGGTLEAIQLWVNLPARHKMTDPSYQSLVASQIPVLNLDAAGSLVRIIAGDYKGTTGPARTFTPINLWDLRLMAGQSLDLDFIAGYSTLLFCLQGSVKINQLATLNTAQLATFEKSGETVVLTALQNSSLLVLNGEPINEAVCGYGPYVMNTQTEIEQAVRDFGYGEFSE